MMVKQGFERFLYRAEVDTGLKQVCSKQAVILKQGKLFLNCELWLYGYAESERLPESPLVISSCLGMFRSQQHHQTQTNSRP